MRLRMLGLVAAGLCVLAMPSAATAAQGDVVWTDQFGGEASEQANGVASDGSGVYVAGRADGPLADDWSPGMGSALVRRYSTAGEVVWTRQFGTGNSDEVNAVAADGSGAYVVGVTYGTFPGQTSAGSFDVFVRKYDTAGGVVWTRQFGTSGEDLGRGIAVDGTGVYVVGHVPGALPGQAFAGWHDVFVRKYDLAGNVLWTREFGTDSFDTAAGVAADGSGVYVTGFTLGALPGQASAGLGDVFVRKYDTAGNVVWTRQFGTEGTEYGRGVAVGGSGVYVAGYTDGAFPGQTQAGGVDAYVRKYDTLGNVVWTRQFGTTEYEQANGVAANGSGVYVTGYTGGALPDQASAGNDDVFVRAYDTAGSHVWTHQFGTARQDDGRGVAMAGSAVYLAGFVRGALPGETYAGYSDVFVRQYDTGGPVTRTATFRSVGAYDGWVLESGETTGKGGSVDAAATTARVGDDASDRQYRSVLHFDTSSLPDDAVITGATLKVKQQSVIGASPFGTHGNLIVDLRAGAFHANAALENADFQSAAIRSNVGRFAPTAASSWYRCSLKEVAYPLVNPTGSTQFRLRFVTDDNDDMEPDYLAFYTGNAVDVAKRPQLIITYYTP